MKHSSRGFGLIEMLIALVLSLIVVLGVAQVFIAAKNTAAKHRRYVGKLYAKEVVLINFPHGSPGDVLERLVEITLRTEDVL